VKLYFANVFIQETEEKAGDAYLRDRERRLLLRFDVDGVKPYEPPATPEPELAAAATSTGNWDGYSPSGIPRPHVYEVPDDAPAPTAADPPAAEPASEPAPVLQVSEPAKPSLELSNEPSPATAAAAAAAAALASTTPYDSTNMWEGFSPLGKAPLPTPTQEERPNPSTLTSHPLEDPYSPAPAAAFPDPPAATMPPPPAASVPPPQPTPANTASSLWETPARCPLPPVVPGVPIPPAPGTNASRRPASPRPASPARVYEPPSRPPSPIPPASVPPAPAVYEPPPPPPPPPVTFEPSSAASKAAAAAKKLGEMSGAPNYWDSSSTDYPEIDSGI